MTEIQIKKPSAQVETLITKSVETKVIKISNDPKCQLCKSTDEATEYILSGRQSITATE